MLIGASTPLDAVTWLENQLDIDEFQAYVACSRLLLNAGADPTIIVDPSYHLGAFGNALTASTTVGITLSDLFMVYDLTLL